MQSSKPTAVKRWETWRFVSRSVLLQLKMWAVHMIMATFCLLYPLNTHLLWRFWSNRETSDVNSWTFLGDMIFVSLNTIAFLSIMLTNVLLYETVVTGIQPADARSFFTRIRSQRSPRARVILHFIKIVVESSLVGPAFFFMAASAEWIATYKASFTHKFEYEVAKKPSLAAVGPELQRPLLQALVQT